MTILTRIQLGLFLSNDPIVVAVRDRPDLLRMTCIFTADATDCNSGMHWKMTQRPLAA